MKSSWKEAPFFHLVWMLICAVGLIYCIENYLGRLGPEGWDNDWLGAVILYALLTGYFVKGCKSGLGEKEAVDDMLDHDRKGD